MIGRLHHVILDCPEPRLLAEFYGELLDKPITHDDGDFVVVSDDARTSGLAFQRSYDHVAPTWPEPSTPQQVHFDVMVEDPVEAGLRVVAMGATHLREDVYADPAGHPFCLILRPKWAPPIK